jgi:hypothetical protein
MAQKVIPVSIDLPTPDLTGKGFFDMLRQATKKQDKPAQDIRRTVEEVKNLF